MITVFACLWLSTFYGSIIKLREDFFCHFCDFLPILWYIIVIVKNVIMEVKMPKAMIDFSRVFY